MNYLPGKRRPLYLSVSVFLLLLAYLEIRTPSEIPWHADNLGSLPTMSAPSPVLQEVHDQDLWATRGINDTSSEEVRYIRWSRADGALLVSEYTFPGPGYHMRQLSGERVLATTTEAARETPLVYVNTRRTKLQGGNIYHIRRKDLAQSGSP